MTSRPSMIFLIRVWISAKSIKSRSLFFFTCYISLPRGCVHYLMSAVQWALSAHMQTWAQDFSVSFGWKSRKYKNNRVKKRHLCFVRPPLRQQWNITLLPVWKLILCGKTQLALSHFKWNSFRRLKHECFNISFRSYMRKKVKYINLRQSQIIQ